MSLAYFCDQNALAFLYCLTTCVCIHRQYSFWNLYKGNYTVCNIFVPCSLSCLRFIDLLLHFEKYCLPCETIIRIFWDFFLCIMKRYLSFLFSFLFKFCSSVWLFNAQLQILSFTCCDCFIYRGFLTAVFLALGLSY